MKMKGRLTGKKIAGCLWAGPKREWTKSGNYYQLEHDEKVSAYIGGPSGEFWIRCDGSTCEITLKKNRKTLSTTRLALPRR